MARLSKFLRLPAGDRRLFVKTMMLVWGVRITLWLLPFSVVRQLLARFARKSVGSGEERVTVGRVVWAVTVASQYVPAATCLTQGLVAKVMLARNGHDATLHLGVARTDAGQFKAHAWVETNGNVVVGGSEASLKQYTALPAVDGESW
jgi:hypothetical protein